MNSTGASLKHFFFATDGRKKSCVESLLTSISQWSSVFMSLYNVAETSPEILAAMAEGWQLDEQGMKKYALCWVVQGSGICNSSWHMVSDPIRGRAPGGGVRRCPSS